MTFAFGDADGGAHTYLCLLSPQSLLPWTSFVADAEGEFAAHAVIKVVLDLSGASPIRYTDGRELFLGHRNNKHCDITMKVRETATGLRVRLRAYVITDLPDFQNYKTVDYDLPLSSVLWRRAARVSDSDVEPEGDCSVFIKATGTKLANGISPSPIAVTDSRNADASDE